MTIDFESDFHDLQLEYNEMVEKYNEMELQYQMEAASAAHFYTEYERMSATYGPLEIRINELQNQLTEKQAEIWLLKSTVILMDEGWKSVEVEIARQLCTDNHAFQHQHYLSGTCPEHLAMARAVGTEK